jgi:microsomal epoxide hydrolase
MTGFDTPPHGSLDNIKPFELHVSDAKLSDFKQLLKLTPLAPTTYENLQADRRFGVTKEWLTAAKEHWLTKFDWRACEKHINSFPNFEAQITDDDGEVYNVHFVALFSRRKDAVPIAFFHGWPGSFLEFLPMMDIIRNKYSSEDLPYHIIVPSLVGYTLSSGPPTNKDFTSQDLSRVNDKLMKELGFGDGYIAQGGDVGSGVTRILAMSSESCKAAHVNMYTARIAGGLPLDQMNEAEKQAMARRKEWGETGTSYASEHGTRPATIGLALASSPLALLAWIGEKFLEWSDEDPSLDTILEGVSLYWFTETFPRCIYPYRERWGAKAKSKESGAKDEDLRFVTVQKPFGYSWFPHELMPTPKAVVAKSSNLVWHRQHTSGGHFAALEKPKEFFEDIEDFVSTAWPMTKGSR